MNYWFRLIECLYRFNYFESFDFDVEIIGPFSFEFLLRLVTLVWFETSAVDLLLPLLVDVEDGDGIAERSIGPHHFHLTTSNIWKWLQIYQIVRNLWNSNLKKKSIIQSLNEWLAGLFNMGIPHITHIKLENRSKIAKNSKKIDKSRHVALYSQINIEISN